MTAKQKEALLGLIDQHAATCEYTEKLKWELRLAEIERGRAYHKLGDFLDNLEKEAVRL